MKGDLLEYIFENSNVYYLSDLKIKSIMKNYLVFVNAIPEDEYTIEAWKETCAYLFGSEGITSPHIAKQALIKWIEE